MLVLSLFLAVQSFDAIPKDRQLYSVDLAREFYATPAAEVDERRAIDQELGELAARRGQLADSAEHLWQTIRTDEALLVRSRRYEAFMHLRAAVDTGDQAAIDAEREISEKVDEVEDDLRREFAAITPEAWARFVAKKSELKPYAWLIRSAATPCAGSANGCGTVPAALQAHIDGWQSDLRDLVAGGDSPQKRDVIAFALIHLASARNAEARLRGYPDAVTEAYARSQWTRKDVAALIDGIAAHADLYRHFQEVRVPPAIKPQFTIDEARTVMLDVLAPLGPVYHEELAGLLDPAHRRLDIVPGPHRRRGGFSLGAPGTPSVFFTSGFTGSYNDLRVLTHESTHAMQRQLQWKHGVLPVYADGPHYLFEATAIFNELLVPDTLARRAPDAAMKQFYLDQFLSGKGIDVIFVTAFEGALEEAVYDGVAAGTIRNADDLDKLTLRMMTRYGISPEKPGHWMDVPLMYEDPFYDVNYAWAGVIALKFFDAFEKDHDRFAKQYVSLLENGFDRPAADLLRDFMDIDLHDPKLLDDALAVASKRIDQLGRR